MQPVRYTADIETIGPDEQRLINEIVEQMAAANLAAFNRHN
ncbi:catalase, partial [Escherichia coli]|nr:catalase [Escherichia coli]